MRTGVADNFYRFLPALSATAFALAVILCLFPSVSYAVKARPEAGGTQITIEKIEEPEAATQTVKTEAATATVSVPAATATAEVPATSTGTVKTDTATATATAEPEEPPVVISMNEPLETDKTKPPEEEKSEPEEKPATKDTGEVAPAQKSSRYEQFKDGGEIADLEGGESGTGAKTESPGVEDKLGPAVADTDPVNVEEVPAVEETPAPEPTPAEPSPEEKTEPEETPAPEEIAEPEKTETAEPEPEKTETVEEPAPEATPEEPEAQPEAEPETKASNIDPLVPSTEPNPEPEPSTEPTPTPPPEAEPAPDTGIIPIVSTPEPEPEPEPAPEPAPAPTPEPTPTPAPEPAPEPKPAEETKPAPAPKPAVPKQEGYKVRSSPIRSSETKERLLTLLRENQYHPTVREEVISGISQYVLEMGTFKEMKHAVNMLLQVKQFSGDFFIVKLGGIEPAAAAPVMDGAGLVPEGRLEGIIPNRKGENGGDPVALMADAATMYKRGPKMEMSGPAEVGTGTGTSSGGAGQIGVRKKGPQLISGEGTDIDIKVEPEDPRIAVKTRLRDFAWEMRSRGYQVYMEEETYNKPEGIMTGVFDTEEDALTLAEELQSYGYSVNVVLEAGIDGRYYVYADTTSTDRDITLITPEKIYNYKKTEEFNPPPNPIADTLLDLSGK